MVLLLMCPQMKPWMKLVDTLGYKFARFKSRTHPQVSIPKKTLFICLDDTSEVIRSLPLIQLLKEQFQESTFSILVGDWARPIVESHPAIDRVLSFNAPWIMNEFPTSEVPATQHVLSLAWELRRRQYDTTVCMRSGFRLNLLSFMSGAPVRIGYGKDGGGFFLTHDVPYDPEKHNLDMNLHLAKIFDLKPYYIAPDLIPSKEDVISTKSILAGLSQQLPIAVIYPGGKTNQDLWDPDKFRKLLYELNSDSYQVLLIGGPNETAVLNKISQGYEGKRLQIWNFPTCGEIVALAKSTDLYIGLNSGTSQIMAAVGAPSVIIRRRKPKVTDSMVGPSTQTIFPTVPCVACCDTVQGQECSCIDQIDVDEVVGKYRIFRAE